MKVILQYFVNTDIQASVLGRDCRLNEQQVAMSYPSGTCRSDRQSCLWIASEVITHLRYCYAVGEAIHLWEDHFILEIGTKYESDYFSI